MFRGKYPVKCGQATSECEFIHPGQNSLWSLQRLYVFLTHLLGYIGGVLPLCRASWMQRKAGPAMPPGTATMAFQGLERTSSLNKRARLQLGLPPALAPHFCGPHLSRHLLSLMVSGSCHPACYLLDSWKQWFPEPGLETVLTRYRMCFNSQKRPLKLP